MLPHTPMKGPWLQVAAWEQTGELVWAWVAVMPPFPITILPMQGLMDGCGRQSWQSNWVPAGGEVVQLFAMFRGMEAWHLAAWAVDPTREELKLVTTGAIPVLSSMVYWCLLRLGEGGGEGGGTVCGHQHRWWGGER